MSEVILPLYGRHQELMQESLRRKIGSLREVVETALKTRLHRARNAKDAVPDRASGEIGEVAGELQRAVGRIAETRERCFEITQDVRDCGESALAEAAIRLTESWTRGDAAPSKATVEDTLVQFAAGKANAIFMALKDLARELAETLQRSGETLGFSEVHKEDDFLSAIQEMPRLEPGSLEAHLQPSLLSKVSKKFAIRQTERRMRGQIGPEVAEAFLNLGRMLDSWARLTLSELQRRFETHADGYRAHLDRIARRGQVSKADEQTLAHDLALLEGSGSSARKEVTTAS
jgi:hypothetical protein